MSTLLLCQSGVVSSQDGDGVLVSMDVAETLLVGTLL